MNTRQNRGATVSHLGLGTVMPMSAPCRMC